jgi:hypothetical protein
VSSPSDEIDFAWACGLFEGEGSISHYLYQRSDCATKGRARRLQLGITDLDVLERFHGIVGVGVIRAQPPVADRKRMHRWAVHDWTELEPLLRRMLPYLGIRRRAAAEALLADPPRRRRSVGWEDGEACAGCGATDKPHKALGRCHACYQRQYRGEQREAGR